MTTSSPVRSSREGSAARRWFIHVARAEGLSFIALLGIAMPLKYLAGQLEAVRWVGWIHGVLFVAFIMALGVVAQVERWRLPRVFAAFVASLLPFGTFVFEAMVLHREGRAGRAADVQR